MMFGGADATKYTGSLTWLPQTQNRWCVWGDIVVVAPPPCSLPSQVDAAHTASASSCVSCVLCVSPTYRYNVALLDVSVGTFSLGLPSFVYGYDNDAIG